MSVPKYSVGERVVIVYNPKDYNGAYAEEHGEVLKTYLHDSGKYLYGIKLDNYTNLRSSTGVYWFALKSIKLENEREETIMFNNYTVAEVEFIDNPNTCKYAYALFDPEIVEGDTVVVSTGHHGFALAKIIAIHTDEEKKKEVQCNREVVCLVDFSQFYARKEAVKRAVELKRKMDKCIREAQELALYEALAEKNPALKGMFDEYKALVESCK